jgi:integrase
MTKKKQKKPPGFGYPTVLEFTDKSVLDYFDVLAAMSPRTAIAARDRLSLLPKFVNEHYGLTVDQLIDRVHVDLDRYQVLAKFAVYLKRDQHKSDDRTRKMIMQTKLLFEHHGIEFSERGFRSRVKLPRSIVRRQKPAVDREQIIQILQAASNQPNLQLCLLWHASTGRRPSEVFSLRHCDIGLEHRRYRVRPEYSKMRTADERPMTAELATRTESYLKWKHRPRDVVGFIDGKKKRWYTRTPPKIRPGDLLFSPYRWDHYGGRRASPSMLYFQLCQ